MQAVASIHLRAEREGVDKQWAGCYATQGERTLQEQLKKGWTMADRMTTKLDSARCGFAVLLLAARGGVIRGLTLPTSLRLRS